MLGVVLVAVLGFASGCGPWGDDPGPTHTAGQGVGTPSARTTTGGGSTDEPGVSSLGTAAQPVPVTFDEPHGFQETQSYDLVIPLYPHVASRWVVPGASPTNGLDVIGIQSYLLDRDTSRLSTAELSALVDGYASKVRATSTSRPVRSTMDGFPALTQSIVQPGAPDGASFTYESTFVFAGPYLVQVMCQYDTMRPTISDGCQTVLATLHLVLS